MIPIIEKFLPVAIFKMPTTIPHKFNIVRFQCYFICGYIMMSRIDSEHWTISTGRHFQNGHHNTTKFQHCSISSKFYMWVDNDVPNWFQILKNCIFSSNNILTLSKLILTKKNCHLKISETMVQIKANLVGIFLSKYG